MASSHGYITSGTAEAGPAPRAPEVIDLTTDTQSNWKPKLRQMHPRLGLPTLEGRGLKLCMAHLDDRIERLRPHPSLLFSSVKLSLFDAPKLGTPPQLPHQPQLPPIQLSPQDQDAQTCLSLPAQPAQPGLQSEKATQSAPVHNVPTSNIPGKRPSGAQHGSKPQKSRRYHKTQSGPDPGAKPESLVSKAAHNSLRQRLERENMPQIARDSPSPTPQDTIHCIPAWS